MENYDSKIDTLEHKNKYEVIEELILKTINVDKENIIIYE